MNAGERRPAAAPGPTAPLRTFVALLAALLLLPASLLSAACGDGLSGDANTAQTYHNDRYGFSITLDERFTEWQKADVAEQGVFGVAFADEDGPEAGDRYLDAILIAVVDLGAELTPEQTSELRALLRTQSDRALARFGPALQTLPPEDVTINGLAGSVVPFSATVDGAGIVGWNYLFINGRYLYVLLVTSGDDTWGGNRTALQRMAESFTVTPHHAATPPVTTTPLPTPSPATPTPGFTPPPTATSPAPMTTPAPVAQPSPVSSP